MLEKKKDDGVDINLKQMIGDMEDIKINAKIKAKMKYNKKKTLHTNDPNVLVIDAYEGQDVTELKKKIEQEEEKMKKEKKKEDKKEEPKKEEKKETKK